MIAGNERATKAEHQSYRRGHKDRTEFFREFLETLAPDDFHPKGYFEAYVKYIEDRHQACIEGKDPELVAACVQSGRFGRAERYHPPRWKPTAQEDDDDKATVDEVNDDENPTI